MGRLKKHVSPVPPTTIEDVLAIFQAVVTKVGVKILKCAQENGLRRCDLSGQRPLRTPAVTTRPPRFDCLILCRI
jgi:hypothetical protein